MSGASSVKTAIKEVAQAAKNRQASTAGIDKKLGPVDDFVSMERGHGTRLVTMIDSGLVALGRVLKGQEALSSSVQKLGTALLSDQVRRVRKTIPPLSLALVLYPLCCFAFFHLAPCLSQPDPFHPQPHPYFCHPTPRFLAHGTLHGRVLKTPPTTAGPSSHEPSPSRPGTPTPSEATSSPREPWTSPTSSTQAPSSTR